MNRCGSAIAGGCGGDCSPEVTPTPHRDQLLPVIASTSSSPSSSSPAPSHSSSSEPEIPVSFYRRQLPELCVDFNSVKGKQIFVSALQSQYMEGYFALASHFHTQSEPAYCGLGTLAMSLNALSVDPLRQWKGVWRFYDENMLDCCKSLTLVQQEGITIPEYVCLARCNGALAQLTYAEESSIEEFRTTLLECTKHQDQVLTCSYSRKVLGQTGDGHFSPIAGYDPASDHCLIMDVARFKYPPHWVPVPLLFEAMLPHDKTTQRSRGFMVLTRGHISILGRLISSPMEWRQHSNAFIRDLTSFLRQTALEKSKEPSPVPSRSRKSDSPVSSRIAPTCDMSSGRPSMAVCKENPSGDSTADQENDKSRNSGTSVEALLPLLATFLCQHRVFSLFETHSEKSLSRLSPLHRSSLEELASQARDTHLFALLEKTTLCPERRVKAVVLILALEDRLLEQLPGGSAPELRLALSLDQKKNALLAAEVETIRDSLYQMNRFCLRCSSK
mmetsp:Transcript_13676/g.41253  ORF Transcript_13676/g.41253 Transcript_13676/m.41253 type:complete len:502 (+) Transcript_13676:89-1594(+)